jgi:Tfp pilus assembly protein PilF
VTSSLAKARNWAGAAAMLALWLLLAAAAAASSTAPAEPVENHISRGLLRFHAGDYALALTEFDAAVKADPVNVEARHYRAMTAARLGNLDDAVFDLGVVLILKPDFCEAALQLGIARMEQGEDADAVRWLESARRCPALDADASLLIGIASLHLEDTEAAAAALERARQTAELRATADYYAGVANLRRWRWKEAESQFGAVQAARPDAEVGVQAAAYLRQLRRYHLYAGVGIDYDSNVVLAPADDSVKDDVGVTNQSDGRVSLSAGATAVPWRTENFQLLVGYDFFQTLQFDLTQFDLTANRPGAQLLFDAGPVYGGLMGRYGYYLLDGASFLQDAVAAPWVAVPERGFGRTELYYRMLWEDFYLSPFRGVRDSVNNAVGARQYVYLPRSERYVVLGYRFENQDATESQGDAFAYDANQVEVGLGWDFTPSLDGAVSYAYRHEDYAAASQGRVDDTNHVVVALRQAVGEWLWVSLAYLGTFNDSNQAVFTYDRNIVSLAVEGRY